MAIFREREKPDTSTLPGGEIELVLTAASGNFAAFERLVEIYLDALWRYALRILGNSEDAHDAVQQTLIQAYQSLPDLRQPEKFRSWLFKIVRNKCFDLRRKAGPDQFSETSLTGKTAGRQSFDLADQAPLPAEIVERHETRRIIRQAITELPEQQRQVAALRYATDLTFQEIGETLGLNENTVKTHFQRAKTALRLYLRRHL